VVEVEGEGEVGMGGTGGTEGAGGEGMRAMMISYRISLYSLPYVFHIPAIFFLAIDDG
jgi:hypothetical protein